MEIISEYLREQKRYTKRELAEILRYDEISIDNFLKILKSYGIVKVVKNNTEQKDMSDLYEEDIVAGIEENIDNCALYVFIFVGVLIYDHRVLKIYPKYLSMTNNVLLVMRQVMKVLEKYNNTSEQDVHFFDGSGSANISNLISTALYLFRDYYEYGVYTNFEEILDVNGEGDIQWQKSIDEFFPIVENNRPIYTELYTRKIVTDDYDFFSRLHRIVLTECSKRLSEAQLLDLFEIDSLLLSDETLEDLGDESFICDKILAELNVQFNSRKQLLLKTLYGFISQRYSGHKIDSGIVLYGTTAFNMVWEKACALVFNNQLKFKLKSIELPKALDESYKSKDLKLIDIIEKPAWVAANREYVKHAKDTLIPDVITFAKYKQDMIMVILDAKYYNLHMEKDKALSGQPGIESVTKQYLYQLAYQEFANQHGIKQVRNCFVLPTEEDSVQDKGSVELTFLNRLNLQNIDVRQVPASLIFSSYLSNEHLDLNILKIL